MTKYRVRVCREDESGQSVEVYSRVVEFDPIKEICNVLNKPRRKVRKDTGVGKEVPEVPEYTIIIPSGYYGIDKNKGPLF